MRKVFQNALFLSHAFFLKGWTLLPQPKSPELSKFKTEWYHDFQIVSLVYARPRSVSNS